MTRGCGRNYAGEMCEHITLTILSTFFRMNICMSDVAVSALEYLCYISYNKRTFSVYFGHPPPPLDKEWLHIYLVLVCLLININNNQQQQKQKQQQ